MRYTLVFVLVLAIVASGCSSETPISSAAPTPTNAQSSDAGSNGEPKSIALASSPKYEAVIVINAAKKGEDGASCSSDMGAKGKSKCGPESSLTDLSWKFTEHLGGSDYYKFNWNLTTNGVPKNGKGLTVGFDGDTETTVVDAEHHIVIRKGPLKAKPE